MRSACTSVWGLAAVGRFNLHGGWALRPTDYGELLVIAGVAGVLFLLVALAHRRADAPARADSRRLLLLLLLLGVFGVAFDLIHSMAGAGTPAALAALVEDGGEMVMMSLIAAYCFEVCCRVYEGGRDTAREGNSPASAASV